MKETSESPTRSSIVFPVCVNNQCCIVDLKEVLNSQPMTWAKSPFGSAFEQNYTRETQLNNVLNALETHTAIKRTNNS